MILVAALVCLALAVGCFVLGWMMVKKIEFPDVKTQAQCTQSLCGTDKSCCTTWVGNMCRKGTLQNGTCVSQGTAIPLLLYILGGILLIAGVYFIFKRKSSSVASFYY